MPKYTKHETGIKFDDDRKPTPEEKELLQNDGFKYEAKPRQAWVQYADAESRSKAKSLPAS